YLVRSRRPTLSPSSGILDIDLPARQTSARGVPVARMVALAHALRPFPEEHANTTREVTMSSMEPLVQGSHVPEDLRAELDAEVRRLQPELLPRRVPPEEVPEDVLAERDLEARVGSEEFRQRLSEGRPPAEEEEPRS